MLYPCTIHATYRLQLGPAFTFREVQALLDYLVDLGISDCYASPIFQARAGSTHGYDICDHGQISSALGGEAAFEAFAAALRAREMLWDLSPVDPDNRRPVDFVLRRALLAALKDRIEQASDDLRPFARELLETSHDGRIKLYLIERVLAFRRAHADLFAQGAYLPLGAQGSKHEHVCAFARIHRGKSAIVVAPRLVAKLAEGVERPPIGEEVWRDTWLELPDAPANARYRNILTGETLVAQARGLRLAAIFSSLPVCLLVRQ
jgi:maltooligosyltrehalose synthase